MRILFILEYYYPHVGGVETFFSSLIKRLDSLGHESIVLTNRFDKNLPAKEKTGKGVTIIRNRYFSRYGFTFFAWWAALKYARKADIIHTTSYNAGVPAWVAAKMTKTKSIITFHERWGRLWFHLPWMSYPSRILHYLFEAALIRLHFDRFVSVSDYTKACLIEGGIKPSLVTRIYNGIDYTGFPVHRGSSADDPFTFLFFGRAGQAKGLDILLSAYQYLSKGRHDHRLILVLPSEDTRLLRKIKKLVSHPDLDSNVQILHDLRFSSLLEQIAVSDAVVIPSYSEGFCFAAVESIAIGTPIVSSGLGALKEVVTGKHITSRDHSVPSMAAAMSLALDGGWDEIPRKEFPIEDTIEKYLRLYQEFTQ